MRVRENKKCINKNETAYNFERVQQLLNKAVNGQPQLFEWMVRGRKQTEEVMAQLASIVESSSDAIISIRLNGIITSWNSGAERIYGYPAEEVIGKSIYILVPPDRNDELPAIFERIERGERAEHYETVRIRKDGKHIYVSICISPIKDAFGRVTGASAIARDITEHKQAEEALYQAKTEAEQAREKAEYLAAMDYLTGVLNRRAFMDRLIREVNRATQDNTPLSVILADIDFFKKVNDTYGHQSGDVVLQQFAKCLSELCRPNDFVGRYGGEEFIICLPGTGHEGALLVAERMRVALQEHLIIIPENDAKLHITASFGVSSLDTNSAANVEKLIAQSDEALYRAKSEGRNRVR